MQRESRWRKRVCRSIVGAGLVLLASDASPAPELNSEIRAELSWPAAAGPKFVDEEVFAGGLIADADSFSVEAESDYTITGYYDVSADTSYGANRTAAHLSVVGGYRASVMAGSYSRYTDDVIIRCDVPELCAGAQDTMLVGFGVHGSYSGHELSAFDPEVYYYVAYSFDVEIADLAPREVIHVYNEPGELQGWLVTRDEDGHRVDAPIARVGGFYTTWVPFEYDRNLRLTSLLLTEAQFQNYESTFSGVADLDFAQTASVHFIGLPSHATLIAASGTVYPTPEPARAAAGLVAVACLALLALRDAASQRARRAARGSVPATGSLSEHEHGLPARVREDRRSRSGPR